MAKHFITLLMPLLLLATAANGQRAVYNFCVSSAKMKTFKARVAFKTIDFGATAARQMVYNDVVKALGPEVQIAPFSNSCACFNNCAVLEVSSSDWDGNMGDNEMSTASILGSLAEMTDKLLSESKAIFTDPGGFLKRNFFSSTGK